MPIISIIILTFNSSRYIKLCLDALFFQEYHDFEAIIIDNGSKDGTVNFIKENYPKVILIENKQNLGACKARNQGIELASGEWILTADCDIIMQQDFLAQSARIIDNLPSDIGIIQPKILNIDAKTIYSTGIYLSAAIRFYDIGKGKQDLGQFDKSRLVFGACSAAAFYRKSMLEEMREESGYFDERFSFLVEDVDISWRAQKRHWKALYSPQAVCLHYGNSSCTNKSLRQFFCWRNRKLMLKKFRLNRFKLMMVYLFYDLPRTLLLFFVNSYVKSLILNRNKKYIVND
jgi:GT2 family glycosyltransferase